jgi:preprotein translocase subunit SecG
MLSFLREQGNGDLPTQQSNPAGESTPNNGNEKPQGQEFLTVASNKKRARKSTTLLAILFIAGLICLAYMIKKSTPEVASATSDTMEDTELETAISRLTGIKSDMSDNMDTVVNKFCKDSDVLQVKVGELVKNPFKLELGATKEPLVEITVPEADNEKVRQSRIRQQAKEMQLTSIMQSDRGNRGKCCMIGDKILYEGDYIKDFKVRQIGNNFVKLEWDPDRNSGTSDNQLEAVEIVLNLSE